MINIRLGRDVLSTATITATSEGTGLGATWYAANVFNPRRDRSWRSTNLTSQSLLITFGGLARTFSWIALPRHRMHGANFRPRFYPTSDGSGSTVAGGDPTGSGGIAVASLLSLPSGANNGLDSSEKQNTDLGYYQKNNHIPYWLPTTLTGVKSIRVDFSNTPEQFGVNLAYYELNRVVAGWHSELTYNPPPDSGFDWGFKSLTMTSRAGGGSNLRMAADGYRGFSINLDWVDPNDMPVLQDLMQYADYSKSLLISLYPTAGNRLERDHSMVGTLSGDLSVGTTWPLYKSKLTFVED